MIPAVSAAPSVRRRGSVATSRVTSGSTCASAYPGRRPVSRRRPHAPDAARRPSDPGAEDERLSVAGEPQYADALDAEDGSHDARGLGEERRAVCLEPADPELRAAQHRERRDHRRRELLGPLLERAVHVLEAAAGPVDDAAEDPHQEAPVPAAMDDPGARVGRRDEVDVLPSEEAQRQCAPPAELARRVGDDDRGRDDDAPAVGRCELDPQAAPDLRRPRHAAHERVPAVVRLEPRERLPHLLRRRVDIDGVLEDAAHAALPAATR